MFSSNWWVGDLEVLTASVSNFILMTSLYIGLFFSSPIWALWQVMQCRIVRCKPFWHSNLVIERLFCNRLNGRRELNVWWDFQFEVAGKMAKLESKIYIVESMQSFVSAEGMLSMEEVECLHLDGVLKTKWKGVSKKKEVIVPSTSSVKSY